VPVPPVDFTRLQSCGSGGGTEFQLRADANPFLTGDVTLLTGAGVVLTQVGQTITIAAAGGAGNKLNVSHDQQEAVNGTTEAVIAEWNVDLADVPAANVQARLAALIRTSGGTGTYNLRTGGTIGAADGTIRATINTASGVYVQDTDIGAAFANPAGQLLVKVTAVNDTVGDDAFIRGIYVSLG
jgi:hypothetical protein